MSDILFYFFFYIKFRRKAVERTNMAIAVRKFLNRIHLPDHNFHNPFTIILHLYKANTFHEVHNFILNFWDKKLSLHNLYSDNFLIFVFFITTFRTFALRLSSVYRSGYPTGNSELNSLSQVSVISSLVRYFNPDPHHTEHLN